MRARKRSTHAKTAYADKRAADVLARGTFRVGESTVTITLIGGELRTEWAPRFPDGLSDQEWEQYRAGRDGFLQRVAASRGLSIVVVEAK
jgi:hypothetical protein